MTTTYEIRHSDGRVDGGFATVDDAAIALQREYPTLFWGHSGDLDDGGERTLCWASLRDSEDDYGSSAVAAIHRVEQAPDWRETVTGETITDEQIQDYHTAAGAAGDLDAVAVCEVALDATSADPNEDDAFTQAIEDAIGEHDQESARAEVARMYRDAWAAEQ
jgi:hypothetical protein